MKTVSKTTSMTAPFFIDNTMEYIAPIISAIGVIITAWFAYNQKTKDRMTDLKIERMRTEEARKGKVRSDNTGTIYGVLWEVLHELHADRVYILQPHPLSNNMFLSISMEVKRSGVVGMKPYIRNMEIGNVAVFASELANRDWLQYRNISEEVKDKRARAILSMNGSVSALIRRLSDDRYDWIGSVFAEFQQPVATDLIYCKKVLGEAADKIQYILPEFGAE